MSEANTTQAVVQLDLRKRAPAAGIRAAVVLYRKRLDLSGRQLADLEAGLALVCAAVQTDQEIGERGVRERTMRARQRAATLDL